MPTTTENEVSLTPRLAGMSSLPSSLLGARLWEYQQRAGQFRYERRT